jgi:hypothetical protein
LECKRVINVYTCSISKTWAVNRQSMTVHVLSSWELRVEVEIWRQRDSDVVSPTPNRELNLVGARSLRCREIQHATRRTEKWMGLESVVCPVGLDRKQFRASGDVPLAVAAPDSLKQLSNSQKPLYTVHHIYLIVLHVWLNTCELTACCSLFFENFNIWQWTTRFCASSVSTRTSSTTMRIPLLFSRISSLQITKYHILDFQVSTRVWKREISRVARPTSVAFVYSPLWFPLRVLTK